MLERDKLIAKCRKHGLKITPQRLAIFDALKEDRSHPSAEMLHKQLSKIYPTITLTTVYKTLEMLGNIGEITVLDINPERRHFDSETKPHHHIICEKCKQIIDIMELNMEIKLPKELIDRFSVRGYHINFYGLCKKCNSN